MMTDPARRPVETLAALDERARDQRQKLISRARIVRERLRPARIAEEAGNRVLDIGLDGLEKAQGMIRANRLKTLGAAAALAAVIARRPLMRWIVAGYARYRGKRMEGDAPASESETKQSGA